MRAGQVTIGVVLLLLPAAYAEVTLTTLLHFSGDGTNSGGCKPRANMILARDGNLYGTTGGSYTYYSTGHLYGVVFRLTVEGEFQPLALFPGPPSAGTYPYYPQGPLVQRSYDGCLYGTALGGENRSGTEFKLSLNGTYTPVSSFPVATPLRYTAGLMEGGDGNFYGTSSWDSSNVWGQVFKLTYNGRLTTLHSFTNGWDGAKPFSGLVEGGDDYLYGTTAEGGANNAGTIFKISRDGSLRSIYSFTGGADGAFPYAGLVWGPDGCLYGTTQSGGTNHVEYGGDGTVFRVTTNGQLTSLVSFNGSNGVGPKAPLAAVSDIEFCGTTVNGGIGYRDGWAQTGYGTVFKVQTNGTLTTIYRFGQTQSNGRALDGAYPQAGVLKATDGNLYGTTEYGGNNDLGTIFRIGPSPLRIEDVLSSGESITFRWNTERGKVYQLECSTNVDGSTWISSGPAVMATNDWGYATDTVRSNGQKFYRILIVP